MKPWSVQGRYWFLCQFGPHVVQSPDQAGLFVPKAERHTHSLHRYRVYRLFTIRWSLLASVRDGVGCHPVCHAGEQ